MSVEWKQQVGLPDPEGPFETGYIPPGRVYDAGLPVGLLSPHLYDLVVWGFTERNALGEWVLRRDIQDRLDGHHVSGNGDSRVRRKPALRGLPMSALLGGRPSRTSPTGAICAHRTGRMPDSSGPGGQTWMSTPNMVTRGAAVSTRSRPGGTVAARRALEDRFISVANLVGARVRSSEGYPGRKGERLLWSVGIP